MNIDQYENRMILALEGDLSDSEYNQLMEEIEVNHELASIWSSYKDLYSDMDNVPQELPSENVRR